MYLYWARVFDLLVRYRVGVEQHGPREINQTPLRQISLGMRLGFGDAVAVLGGILDSAF